MPFKSEKQRRFMYSQHPEIAQRWTEEGKGNVVPGKMKYNGETMADNKPVGSAGQPQGRQKKMENRAGAIKRRIDKMNSNSGKTNGKGGY